MGQAIAYAAAYAGCRVGVTDADPAVVRGARGHVEALVAEHLKCGTLRETDRAAIHTRLQPEASLALTLREAEVVVEAVDRTLTPTQRLFAELERLAPPGALLTTTSASLAVGQIAAAVREPARVIGVHFAGGVAAAPLVEIVTHARSEAGTVERAVAFARTLGKEPFVVRDAPGYASSDSGVALGLEAMRLLEQGGASAEDIDRTFTTQHNQSIGPLRLSDLVGLDARLAAAERLAQRHERPEYDPPRILRDLVARGDLGRKTGKGFYVWSA
jgi:3-hydroxybutyryl-CoA dehydrogenase